MLQPILPVVFSVIALTSGKLGPCNHPDIKTDPEYDLDKFANEKDGKWKFWLVPEQWDALTYLDMDPTGKKDEYKFVMYKNHEGGQPLKFLEGTLEQTGRGRSTFTGQAGGQPLKFEMFFLKFVPKRYAYYYVCSNQHDDQKNDLTTDYRYVVTHGPLTEKEEEQIKNIDSQIKPSFKGKLKKNEVLDGKGEPKKQDH